MTAMKKSPVRKTDTVSTKQETTKEVKNTKVEESKVEETKVVENVEKKVYKPTDGVVCRSITPGGLYMDGIKTGIAYEWEDCGLETEVEYQDLIAAIRSNHDCVMKPYFLIQDADIVNAFPNLKKIYDTMYTVGDLEEILSYSGKEMRNLITMLPQGAQESIKALVSKKIASGELDSVQKIKILDEIFDTEFMLMTGLFN